jgi:hypothetical protein
MNGGGHGRVRRGGRTAVQTPRTTIFFQLFPGVHGRPRRRGDTGVPLAQRAIAGVPFEVTFPGSPVQNGNTGPDGSIGIAVPAGATQCTLRIFDVDYQVRFQDAEMLFQPGSMQVMHEGDTDGAFVGVKELLYRLGYHTPAGFLPFSDQLGKELDKAILDFQVNERLQPRADGGIGPTTFRRMELRFRQH